MLREHQKLTKFSCILFRTWSVIYIEGKGDEHEKEK